MKPWKKRRGMSLVEVMVVIAIILVVMSVLAFGVMSSFKQAQVDMTVLTMGQAAQKLVVHGARHGTLPTTGEGLKAAYPHETPPADAWGGDLVYERVDKDYELLSYGDDGTEGGTAYGSDIRWSEHRGH